ncbi:MAG: hypothetical protein U5L11_09185 [Arhodomonas sp.]|nr:hypothetical protein [Arhodomonas sp.]
MKTRDAQQSVARDLMGGDVELSDRCCGEAGPFAAEPSGYRQPGALPQGGRVQQGA